MWGVVLVKILSAWSCAVRIILLLVLVGVFYIWIGLKDSFSELTFAIRILGVTIFISGIIILCAGVATWQIQRIALRAASSKDQNEGDSWDKPILKVSALITVVGIALALISSLLLFIAQPIVYDITPMMVVWAAIAAASIWALSQARKARLSVSIGAKNFIGGLSVALLIPIFGIAYTQFYLPSASPEDLVVSASLSRATLVGSKEADIPFSITVTNQQHVGVYVLAAYYEVTGHTGIVSKPTQTDFLTNEDHAGEDLQIIRRYLRNPKSYMLQAGSIITAGSFIEPGGKSNFKDTVAIPVPTPYEAIQVRVMLAVMRNDKVTLSPEFDGSATHSWDSSGQNVTPAPQWVRGGLSPSTHYLEWQGQLWTSRLSGLMSRPRTVYVWYLLPSFSGTSTGPYIDAGVSSTGTEPSTWTAKDAQRELERYGLGLIDGDDITVATSQLGISPPK